MLPARPNIADYFAGKNVFITGGSGFMGKVLIEKLLRSCPKIGRLYVLMRNKRGKTKEIRVQEILDAELFETLKAANYDFEQKLVPILGDVMLLRLGLSEEDRALLVDNVSVIFHVAASVRFNEPLKNAVLMNTRGTREVCNLGLDMKKLEVFLYVSTTYSNADKKEVSEELYEAPADWRQFIQIAEQMDNEDLQKVTVKCRGNLPNTYTFTKSMAEQAVNDICVGKFATIILRPSIVFSTVMEPVKGWVENYNGPVGIMVGGGKGLFRTIYADPDVKLDYIPVDDAIKGMIMAVWQKGTSSDPEEKNKLSVYNASGFKDFSVSMGQMVDLCHYLNNKLPLANQLWHANITMSRYKATFWFKVVFLHIFPAFFFDLFCKLTNRKSGIVTLQRRIYQTNLALQYYMLNEWNFLNDKFLGLENTLLTEDKENFKIHVRNLDVYGFFDEAYVGYKKYLLKENMEQIKEHKRRSRK